MIGVMLDLETLSTRSNAVILAVGACAFDNKELIDSFYRVVDIDSAVKAGGHISADTFLWWLRQSEEARNELTSVPHRDSIETALLDFNTWLTGIRDCSSEISVWGNGSDFDNAILAHTYQRCNMSVPWHFWQNRCYRTIKKQHLDITPDDIPELVAHRADHDAIYQTKHLQKIIANSCVRLK